MYKKVDFFLYIEFFLRQESKRKSLQGEMNQGGIPRYFGRIVAESPVGDSKKWEN